MSKSMPYSFLFRENLKILFVVAGSEWNSNIAWDLDVEIKLSHLRAMKRGHVSSPRSIFL